MDYILEIECCHYFVFDRVTLTVKIFDRWQQLLSHHQEVEGLFKYGIYYSRFALHPAIRWGFDKQTMSDDDIRAKISQRYGKYVTWVVWQDYSQYGKWQHRFEGSSRDEVMAKIKAYSDDHLLNNYPCLASTDQWDEMDIFASPFTDHPNLRWSNSLAEFKKDRLHTSMKYCRHWRINIASIKMTENEVVQVLRRECGGTLINVRGL